MVAKYTPAVMLKHAKQTALDNNMVVTERGGRYFLYRQNGGGLVGSRNTVKGILCLCQRAAGSTKEKEK